jgi:predicted PurR-regulated permease PerM
VLFTGDKGRPANSKRLINLIQDSMERKKITFDSFIRGVILGVIIIGILMLLKRLSSVLLPFFIAWLIAYLVYPLVTFFQYKLKLRNRIVSIFCALLTLLIVGAGAFYLLVPPMIQECGRVQTLLVQYFSHGTYNSNVPTSLSDFLRDNIDVKFITELFNKENLLDALKEAVPRLWSLLSDSVDLLFSVFTIFIILLYVIFILLDYESIAEGWTHLVPMKYRSFVVGILNDVKVGMNRYFRGQAFVALCVGILFSIGFLIIDFPLAIGLGLFIGALNMVPYLQIIGLVPTIILAILKASDTGENFWIIIASAMAVFIVVQTIQDGFIVPRVMGKITGLNPAIILLSLSIWGSLMGMLGMIIALPLTTLMLCLQLLANLHTDGCASAKTEVEKHKVGLVGCEHFPERVLRIGCSYNLCLGHLAMQESFCAFEFEQHVLHYDNFKLFHISFFI